MKLLLFLLLATQVLSQDVKTIVEVYNPDFINTFEFDESGHLIYLQSKYIQGNTPMTTTCTWRYNNDQRMSESKSVWVYPVNGEAYASVEKNWFIEGDTMLDCKFMFRAYEHYSKQVELYPATYVITSLKEPSVLDTHLFTEKVMSVKYDKYNNWILTKSRIVHHDDAYKKPMYSTRKRTITYY